ncbi:MAG: hypothetical protein KGI47_06795 [Betaproteobacteria bacterium]|nr:hypothetical protein [Betaproteobacteria bacterium]MDE2623102.1 hypothetical protein [Betaproteobacteria bacterium]
MCIHSCSIFLRRFLAAGLFLSGAVQAPAADYFDGHSLTIPMVSYGSNVYTNVKITVANVIGAQSGTAQSRFDSYSGGTLFIPSVYYNGTLFTNVSATVGQILSCCGVASANAYLLVANPSDQTIKAYPYTNATQAVSQVSDPALAQQNPNRAVKMTLDKTHNLLFDVVRMSSGGVTITPFSFNATTGVLGAAGPATTYSGATNVLVNPLASMVMVVYKSGPSVSFYSYNTATGAIGTSLVNSQTSTTIGTLSALDPVNNLAFSMATTGFITYPTTTDSITLKQVASVTSPIPVYGGGSDSNIYSQPDMTGHALLLMADAASGAGTEFQVIPYSSSTLGPVGNVLTDSTSDYLCGFDPTNHLLFVSAQNSTMLRAYAYSTAGGLSSASSTDMSTSPIPNGYQGGCNDVDPVNHLLITSYVGTTGSGVAYYLYTTANGALSTVPAGSFSVTPGTAQLGILSSNSVTTAQ